MEIVLAKEENDKYRAPALDKGLDILELLAESPAGLTQIDIAKGLGKAANEIYRMLTTLVRRNYVTQSPDGNKYMLSLKLMVLANKHPPKRRILDIAEPLMRCAAQDSEQSCHLSLWDDGNVVIASAFSAPGNWRLSLRPGSIVGLYNTGSGHVLAAFQTEERLEKMLHEHLLAEGEPKIQSEDFKKSLSKVRKQGHLISHSQTVRGVFNISFPILDPSGNAIAALTCPFVERIDDFKSLSLDEVTAIFRKAAIEIGQQISGV